MTKPQTALPVDELPPPWVLAAPPKPRVKVTLELTAESVARFKAWADKYGIGSYQAIIRELVDHYAAEYGDDPEAALTGGKAGGKKKRKKGKKAKARKDDDATAADAGDVAPPTGKLPSTPIVID